MKQKKIFDKVMKIFAVMVFILSMCFSQKYANNVEAWDNSTPHEFTRIKQIDYPWWWSSKIASAKKWSTYMCKYDNKYGYSACRLVDGGTDAGHRGAASRIRTGMEECLTDAKTRAFLRTLSRTGLAGRLQPVLCFATDVIRGRCSQRLSITNNIDSIFDNDQL